MEINSFVSSTVSIPYLDTLIANINSRFSGVVVELVVSSSSSVFNPALNLDDEALFRAYGNYKLKTMLTSIEKTQL